MMTAYRMGPPTHAEVDRLRKDKARLQNKVSELEAEVARKRSRPVRPEAGATYEEDDALYCSTCGTEVEVAGLGTTRWYVPAEPEVLARGAVQEVNPGGAILGVIHIAHAEVEPGQEFRIIRDTSREERDD